jgi:hypothetical protein
MPDFQQGKLLVWAAVKENLTRKCKTRQGNLLRKNCSSVRGFRKKDHCTKLHIQTFAAPVLLSDEFKEFLSVMISVVARQVAAILQEKKLKNDENKYKFLCHVHAHAV